MDILFRFSDRVRGSVFFKKLLQLPPKSSGFSPRFALASQWIKPILWIGLSLILGIKANALSADGAKQEWEARHRPSEAVWKYALERVGCHSVVEPKRQALLIRSLPSRIEEPSNGWITAEDSHIAFWGDETPPTLKTFECRPHLGNAGGKTGGIPSGWQPIGRTWEAFEKVVGRLEASAKVVIHHSAIVGDPREIRY